MTTEITGKAFADTVEQGIVLVDWWAAWCGPCRAFAPAYERVAARNPDLVFAKVDVDAEVELAAAFEIRSIPTLMAFRDGVLVFRQAGALSEAALDRLVALVRELDMEAVLERVAR
jgi:thioredoxin 1